MHITFIYVILLKNACLLFVKIIELLKKIAYFTANWLLLLINQN